MKNVIKYWWNYLFGKRVYSYGGVRIRAYNIKTGNDCTGCFFDNNGSCDHDLIDKFKVKDCVFDYPIAHGVHYKKIK